MMPESNKELKRKYFGALSRTLFPSLSNMPTVAKDFPLPPKQQSAKCNFPLLLLRACSHLLQHQKQKPLRQVSGLKKMEEMELIVSTIYFFIDI
jgi:hypothetical protein